MQTLVLLGMVISLIMLVVGSNIARAFALVGALSIIRFRNAIKETRDVGFIFLVMAHRHGGGHPLLHPRRRRHGRHLPRHRRAWTASTGSTSTCSGQVVKVQVPPDEDYTPTSTTSSARYTAEFELVSAESIRGGALIELVYTVRLKPDVNPGELTRVLAAAHLGAAGHRPHRLRPHRPVVA